jgi:hypothetical protein
MFQYYTDTSSDDDDEDILEDSDYLFHYSDDNDNDDFSDDELLEYETDRIYIYEMNFLDAEKEPLRYYIGIPCAVENDFIMNTCISATSFFHFPIQVVKMYLTAYSVFQSTNRTLPKQIEIMQLQIVNGVYRVILKTFWLRIIQRTWKRVYKERMAAIERRKSVRAQMHREIYGKYPVGMRLPTIHGIL